MAGSREAPLDEIQFRREDVLQYWGGVHTNSIHGYFKESPFFDHTSRNGLLWEQGFLNQDTFELCASRDRLEATLRAGTGLEYMVTGEPQPSDDPIAQGPDSAVWVLRKQERAKSQKPNHSDLTVLGTYYAVGHNLYQAPSVYDIVGNHLMSAMTSLNKFMDEVSALPLYSPSTGYTYMPTAEKDDDGRDITSREGSLAPVLEANRDAPTLAGPTNSTAPSTSAQARTTALLEQSFLMMRDHADEFSNENPLIGEPGNFVFTHTKDRLRARRAAEQEATAAAMTKLSVQEHATSSGLDNVKSGTTTPATGGAVKTEADGLTDRPKKMSRSEASGGTTAGKKRKKSKISSGIRSGSNSARNSPVLDGTSSPVVGSPPPPPPP